jgi:hypothetical protein
MSLLSWIYGDDENAQRAAEADAKLRELNEADAARYGDAWKSQVYRNYQNQVTFNPAEQEQQIDDAFAEGWNDGKKNVTGFVSGAFKVVRDVLSSVLLGIPFWVWAAAGVFVWGYLGFPGLKALKKKFA